MLSAGLIPHNSIHLLIITTDFVALYWFTGYVVFIITSFLAGVESGDQCLHNSKVLSCFSGVIMSIRSFFLSLKFGYFVQTRKTGIHLMHQSCPFLDGKVLPSSVLSMKKFHVCVLEYGHNICNFCKFILWYSDLHHFARGNNVT